MKMVKRTKKDKTKTKAFHKHREKRSDHVVHSISIPRQLFEELETIAREKNISRNALVNFALLDFVMDKDYLMTLATVMGKKDLKQLLALNFHEKVNYINDEE